MISSADHHAVCTCALCCAVSPFQAVCHTNLCVKSLLILLGRRRNVILYTRRCSYLWVLSPEPTREAGRLHCGMAWSGWPQLHSMKPNKRDKGRRPLPKWTTWGSDFNIIRQGSLTAEPRTGLFSLVTPKVSTREIASFVLTDGIEQNLQTRLPFETDKHSYTAPEYPPTRRLLSLHFP